jgi:hypothetical protein
MERYPIVQNNVHDLNTLLDERMPPPPDPCALMSQFEVYPSKP